MRGSPLVVKRHIPGKCWRQRQTSFREFEEGCIYLTPITCLAWCYELWKLEEHLEFTSVLVGELRLTPIGPLGNSGRLLYELLNWVRPTDGGLSCWASACWLT